jgi:hypothetical protein
MAPYYPSSLHHVSRASDDIGPASHPSWNGDWRAGNTIEGFIVEGWGEGFLVGGLLVRSFLTYFCYKFSLPIIMLALSLHELSGARVAVSDFSQISLRCFFSSPVCLPVSEEVEALPG